MSARVADRPLVSVLVPNYNGEAHLEEAVRSGLAQTYRPFEMVIVDDGSTDGSMAILERLAAEHSDRIRLYTHPGHANRGLIATYELALANARGAIVGFLESDDLWHPDNLKRKVEVLERHPEVGVVHADYRPFGSRRAAIYWGLFGLATRLTAPFGKPYEALGLFRLRNPIPSFTHFVVRRELMTGIPPQELMLRNCDWWALAHISARTKFYFLPERLSSWRIHGGSSHYGPVRVPLDELRAYLLALYASLLASPAVRDDASRRERIEHVRARVVGMDPRMLADPRRFLRSLLREPALTLGLAADALVRWILFAR